LFKHRPSQSYSPYSIASIDVKTGSPELEDIATILLLINCILCCDSSDMPMVAQPLHELQKLRKMDHRLMAVSATKKKMASVGSLFHGCATIMPIGTYAILGKVISKSAGSGEPVFTLISFTLWSEVLRRLIFKQKKGTQPLV
jgi:hypothetical protein